MSISEYVALSRQSGLLKEMDTIANNIANMSTSGYRREGLIFTEMIDRADKTGADSVSMTDSRARYTDTSNGGLTKTNSPFDLAIQGSGYFMVETPQGQRLTRAGTFTLNQNGEMVTPEGNYLLDTAGAPIFVPPDASNVRISNDGTISVGNRPVGQVGVYEFEDRTALFREDGVNFRFENDPVPSLNPSMRQGYVENSNVDPVLEISRMIEVQRAYELGQGFLDREHDRMKTAVQTLGKTV